MIPGIVDSQLVQSGDFDDQLEPPVWLPEGALIHLDWVNGNFFWDGEEKVDTDGLGGSYDPSDVDAAGLLMRLSPNMNGISLTGTMLSTLVQLMLDGCTIVVDADAESGGVLTWVEGMFVWFMDNVDPDSANDFVTFDPSTSPRSCQSSFPHGDGAFAYAQLMNSFGINSFAWTINAPFGSDRRTGHSINGKTAAFEDANDAVQDVQASWPRVDLFAIQEWDFGLQDCYVRRLTVYSPATVAADLQALAQPYFLDQEATAEFADVVLLCHFNGSDGSTSTSDSSGSAHAVSLSGGAELDDAQAAFGSASLMFPGTGSPLMSVANSADFQLGSAAFVVELSIRFENETMSTPFVVGLHQAGEIALSLEFSATIGGIDMALIWSADGTTTKQWSIGTFDPSNLLGEDTWYSIAVERDDQGLFRLSIDGVLKFTRFLGALHATASDLRAEWFTSGSGCTAWLDDFRITKGSWWYGPDVVDQSAQFPDS